MSPRSEVGIGVKPIHKEPLLEMILNAFGEPDLIVDDEERFIVIYKLLQWTMDISVVSEIVDWLAMLPENEWGWIEIYPGDDGPVIESAGAPYEFDFYYECKIVVGQ